MSDETKKAPWQWWAGSDAELFTVGPEDTRDAIIQEAIGDQLGEFQCESGVRKFGFHIVEARQDPLRLADWIDFERMLESAEEHLAESDRTCSEYDDGPWFQYTPAQERDLHERIKRACDEWQTAHGLVFKCRTFSDTRGEEYVIVDHPSNASAPAAATESKAND